MNTRPVIRPFPWWLLTVTVGMLGALALLWRITEPAPVPAAIAASEYTPASGIVVVTEPPTGPLLVILATPIPTRTPYPTPTHPAPPTCATELPSGTLCRGATRMPVPMTVTSVPLCPTPVTVIPESLVYRWGG